MAWLICLFIISVSVANAYAQTCGFIAGKWFCFNASFVDADVINWTSLSQDVQNSGINWTSLNRDIQTGAINWTSVKNLEIQRSGINWSSLVDDIQATSINWEGFPNYSDGKTLKARTASTGGVNWE